MRVKIPAVLYFLAIFGLSLLSLAGAFALSWSGKNSGISFLVASSFFATVAATFAATGKSPSPGLLALVRQMKL